MYILTEVLFTQIFDFQEYVSYYKEWGPSAPPVQVLCPIDHSKDDNSSEEGATASATRGGGAGQGQQGAGSERQRSRGAANNGARGRGGGADVGRPYFPHAQSMRVNGRRVLVCNFNGLFFQASSIVVIVCYLS